MVSLPVLPLLGLLWGITSASPLWAQAPSLAPQSPLGTAAASLPTLVWCQQLPSRLPHGTNFLTWITDEAETGNPQAQFCLSFYPKELTATPPNVWLYQAANGGLPDAQLLLAIGYEIGMWDTPDPHTALYWYQMAGNQAFGPAQVQLAAIYFEGRLNQPKDLQQAWYWITQPPTYDIDEAIGLREAIQEYYSTPAIPK